MASTIPIILMLLGGFVMAVGYGSVSDCLRLLPNSPNGFCWENSVFYLEAAIITLGTIILVGPNVARSLGKWRSEEPDSDP